MSRPELPLRPIAWVAWAATAAFTLLNAVLLAGNYSTPSTGGTTTGGLEFVAGAGYFAIATIGLAAALRSPRNRSGWAFLAAGGAVAFGAFTSEYAAYGLITKPGALPGGRWAAWLGAWTWWAGASFGLAFALLLYPDGALPSSRWRSAARLAAFDVVLLALLHALTPGPLHGEYAIARNPLGFDPAGSAVRSVRDLSWLLVATNAAIGTAAVLRRARTHADSERRPLYWLAGAGAATALAAMVWGVDRGDDGASSTAQLVVALAVLAVPAAGVLASAQTASLRRSMARLVAAREEERLRIRRDLHDGLGPTLAGVTLQLDVARTLVATDPAAAEAVLDRVSGQMQLAVGDIRHLVDELRPPVLDQLGLVAAVEQSASFLAHQTGGCRFEVSVTATGELSGVPPAVELAAYRIVMEAVTNACRHAQASTCRVRLELDRSLGITVEDDGVGVPSSHQPGVGLASMRERAAELGGNCRVEPRAGGGTVVRANLPVAP